MAVGEASYLHYILLMIYFLCHIAYITVHIGNRHTLGSVSLSVYSLTNTVFIEQARSVLT